MMSIIYICTLYFKFPSSITHLLGITCSVLCPQTGLIDFNFFFYPNKFLRNKFAYVLTTVYNIFRALLL